MTDQELEEHLSTAEQVGTYEYRNEEDEDDWFTAALYRAADGRHFRVVDAAGYNSQFDAAGNIGWWLTEEEVANWTAF